MFGRQQVQRSPFQMTRHLITMLETQSLRTFAWHEGFRFRGLRLQKLQQGYRHIQTISSFGGAGFCCMAPNLRIDECRHASCDELR